MTVRELIKELLDYNPEATVQVIVYNYVEEFDITYGSSDGCTKENCDNVSLFVSGSKEQTKGAPSEKSSI